MLDLRNLVKYYRSGGEETVRALDGVSMSVEARELVALYGPSGSGKTTLLSIVAALMPPDAGAVMVGGLEVSALSPAIDNAALKLFGMRMGVREAHRRAAPLMERLGLGQRLGHRPDQLSAGERQRVLIARALSTRPSLVLADEPTGSLDTKRSRDVLTLLTEVCREQGAAMLLVTHDPQAAAFARRVHALVDGRIVAHEPDMTALGAPGSSA
jgi:putative ABC transport system ATP-binding protein